MDTSAPTARFLQARITHSTSTLITRFENILAIALPSSQTPPSTDPTTTTSTSPQNPSTIAHPSSSPSTNNNTATAIESFNLEVETTALVKAAEDLMALNSGLKEVWLLKAAAAGTRIGEGGWEPTENRGQAKARVLDDDDENERTSRADMDEDIRVVVDYLDQNLS